MQRMIACFASTLLLATCSWAQVSALQLPEPPQQLAAWHADAKVPTNVQSAAQTLFAQGFPDPRGCAYRELEIEVSGVWGGKASRVKTRGWVLPKKSRGTNQFAVCWNGLIYPVEKVSVPADLPTEVTNAMSGPRWGFNSAPGENATVFFTSARTTRVLLLLRCGETEEALKRWSPNPRMITSSMAESRGENYDPYLDFASDWAWAMFDRTICAHMRGDEALALATARQLAEVQPKIEAECAKRGFRRQPYFDSARQGKEKPYLDFLEQLPQILADLQRRVRDGNRVSVVETGLQKIPSGSARIAALIRDLDLVQARQWGQPGWVNLAEDPIISALIREGDPAVEPLLDCLEQDQRLTRSVGFHRDFFRGRTVVSVNSAAMVAVQAILQVGFHNVAELRAYWDKYKGMTLDERCYAILEDDSAGARWLEAAAHITQPENETTYPAGFSMIEPPPTNAPVRMHGESLRGKSNPSVSELLAKRALELPARDPNSYDLSVACQMGLRLANWDAQAAKPVARTLVKRCCDVMKYSDQRLGTFVAKLSVARAQAGDTQAFDEYVAWLKTTTPEQLENSLMDCLEPFRAFPTNDVLESAAESLFSNTSSVWNKYPWTRAGLQNPIESDLIKVRAFRNWVSRRLDDRSICGSIEYRAPDNVMFQITNYMSGSRAVAFPANQRPANGAKADLRWCDWIAFSLSNMKQIPFFDPLAPIGRRDEAIKDAKLLLEER